MGDTGTVGRMGRILALGSALVVAAVLLGVSQDFFNYREGREVLIKALILRPDGEEYEGGLEVWGMVHWSVEGNDTVDQWPTGTRPAHSIWQRIHRPYEGGNVSARFQVRLLPGHKLYVMILAPRFGVNERCTSDPQPRGVGQIDFTCSWPPQQ
jgi:hypothetical protein